ncbi:type 4a pilus biogenesis protein PilO [Gammaproteobacteria bacterium]|mgnify:FL=1|nr:type 4a pilus biogenesis protein PilO [Gammaproteobacteria bacterium]
MSIVDDMNSLDLQNPGLWPTPFKTGSFVIFFLVIIFAGWHFDITDQRSSLSTLEKKETEQIGILKVKQKKAANLNALIEQMEEMEQTFGNMVRQLPNKTEVAGLLIDISQTGLSSGLNFKLFEPNAETPKEFYAELPISISVVGNYHQFGEFISGIASLPRIVTTHDVSIKTTKDDAVDGIPLLVMTAIAKTYRALEEEDE